MATCIVSTLEKKSLKWEIAPWERRQEEAGNKAFPQLLSDEGKQEEGRVGAGEIKRTKWWKQSGGWEKKNVCIQAAESILIDILDSYHPDRIHPLNEMCHTDVVTRGISREDGGKEQQRDPFRPGLASFLPSLVLAVFIVPSQSTQVYLEGKLEAFSAHHHQQTHSRWQNRA